MTEFSGAWSRESVESFFDAARVPVRIACRTPNGGLWMLSLWYRHDDGRLWCATGADADIVGYLRNDPGIAFEVSTNRPPYMGVRGAGEAEISPDEDKELLRSLLERYLGGTDSGLAELLLDDDREEVRIAIDPLKCYSWDFGDRMPDSEEVPGGEVSPPGE